MPSRFPLSPRLVLGIGFVALLLVSSILFAGRGAHSPEALPPGVVPDYTRDVAPILARRCVPCHAGSNGLGGYDVSSYAATLASGDHAPNIIPGDRNSPLLQMVRREPAPHGAPMPPNLVLTPTEIDILERWITAGAPDGESRD